MAAASRPYICTGCGVPTARDLLTVKKVFFQEMGEGGRTLKSRVVDWLCPKCVAADEDWQRPAFRPPVAKSSQGVVPAPREGD